MAPRFVRSDNGPELLALPLRTFFENHGMIPSRITPGKSWQNGRNESPNDTIRRECLDAEVFHSLAEARVPIEDWRRLYNQQQPHSTLDYQKPDTPYWGRGVHEPGSQATQNCGGEIDAHKMFNVPHIINTHHWV